MAQDILFMLVSGVVGILLGYYFASNEYRKKEMARKAVEDYKRHKQLQYPPPNYDEQRRNAIAEVQRFCDSYTITDDGFTWTYQTPEEPK